MRLSSLLSFCLIVLLVVSCSSSSTTSSDSTSDSDSGDTVSAASTTVPADVVLSSLTESSAGSSNLTRFLTKKLDGDPTGDDFVAKKEALDALIEGEGECAFTLAITAPNRPNCYGPRVDYTNHPGGGNGQLPGSDVGIWSEYEGTDAEAEACAAAQINYLVRNVASRVDNIISLVGATACAGKKADITLPAENEAALDLTTAMENNIEVTGLTVEEATLDRLADTSDSKAQYQTHLEVAMTVGANTYNVDVDVIHIPENADNTLYRGKIAMKFSDANASDGNCTITGQTGITFATVILYDKPSTTQVDYEMNYAQFCGTNADPFDADFNIDPADKATATNTDGWGADWNYGRFQVNPTSGEGTVMYAWQAGASDGASRVLNVDLTVEDDGSATGNAWYGFGGDMENDGIGSIEGMVCNWAGPGQTRGVGNYATVGPLELVQYQGLTRADADSVIRSDTANLKISYAPNNSCDYAGGTFTYQSFDQDNSTVDNTTGALVTNNLKTLANYQAGFTALTALEDI